MLKYLLDTNIVIYVIKRRPIEVLDTFNKHHGAYGNFGYHLGGTGTWCGKSQFPARNLSVVEDFCSRLQVLPYNEIAAYHYGSIRAALERIGQPIRC